MTTLDEELKHPLNSRMLVCPVQGQWSSFQLVDEFGEGQPYAGLSYEVVDSEGHSYTGRLDTTGTGKVENHFAGPIALILDKQYQGTNKAYTNLQKRPYYPLPITELQVCAEQTRYVHQDGAAKSKFVIWSSMWRIYRPRSLPPIHPAWVRPGLCESTASAGCACFPISTLFWKCDLYARCARCSPPTRSSVR